MSVVAGAQASCALLYDFDDDGGGGKATGTRATTGTEDASGTGASAASGTSAGTGGWCTPDRCFGASCIDADTCDERRVDLSLPGQRVHIYAAGAGGPSVAVVTWDDVNVNTLRPIAVEIARTNDEPEPIAILSATDNGAGYGFVAHDTIDLAISITPDGGPQLLKIFEIASSTEKRSYDLGTYPMFQNQGHLNGLQPHAGVWFGVTSQAMVRIDPLDPVQGIETTNVSVAGYGHGLVPFGLKGQFAYSSYASSGNVGVVARNDESLWATTSSLSNVPYALGIASDDEEIFFRANGDDQVTGIVGAWNPDSKESRVVVTLAGTASQFIAVDGSSVYFDTRVGEDWLIQKCPKGSSAQDSSTCEIVSGPTLRRATGGMASAHLAAGTADDRWLVCFTADATAMEPSRLRCRVTH